MSTPKDPYDPVHEAEPVEFFDHAIVGVVRKLVASGHRLAYP